MKNIAKLLPKYHITLRRGGVSCGSGGMGWSSSLPPLSLRDSTPSPTKGSQRVLFYDIFRPTNSKIFLEVPSRQYILFLKGSAHRKKRNFLLVKFFQKVPEKQRKILSQNRLVIVFWQCSEINLIDQIKKIKQIFEKN